MEIIMAVAIIIIALIFVLLQNNFRAQENAFLLGENAQQIECSKVAEAASLVQGRAGTAEMEIFVSGDFNIVSDSVEFEKAFCRTSGSASDYVLSRGYIRVSNTPGGVSFENV